jgi:hypothetical protein
MPQSEASKATSRERSKRWREANKLHISEYQKNWREANVKKIKVYQCEYHAEYRQRDDVLEKVRYRGLQKYGLTSEGFNEIWTSQNGKCAICETEMLPRGRKRQSACVDHNHITGDVRGLLCRECNNGIGCLKDDPKILESAIKYLNEAGHYSSLRHSKTGD